MENSCRRTILACYIGYIVQAIVNNFVPLLFVMFERTYQIPLAKITLLITINFCIQLAVDLLSAWFLDRIGYRAAILLSHIASAAGLVLLTILPDVLPNAFTGLLIAVTVYAIGGGLLEVIVSPVRDFRKNCWPITPLPIRGCRSERPERASRPYRRFLWRAACC